MLTKEQFSSKLKEQIEFTEKTYPELVDAFDLMVRATENLQDDLTRQGEEKEESTIDKLHINIALIKYYKFKFNRLSTLN